MSDLHQFDEGRVRDAVLNLSEYFDTVQIFVTKHEAGTDDGGTGHADTGAGNWFARYGQVKDWINSVEERTRQKLKENE